MLVRRLRVLGLAVYPCREIGASPIPRGFLPRVGAGKALTYLFPGEDARLLGAAPTDERAGVDREES